MRGRKKWTKNREELDGRNDGQRVLRGERHYGGNSRWNCERACGDLQVDVYRGRRERGREMGVDGRGRQGEVEGKPCIKSMG